VTAELRDGGLWVCVRDDGAGGADPACGSGLVGLKDRIEAFGGTMTLDSPSGGGTTLVAQLPLP
jgi:signal transduction histidine kinase